MAEVNPDDNVTLVSCDGQECTVTVKVAQMSETVKHLIEDTGIENPIPLPNVTGKILTKVVEYCKHHSENPEPESEKKEKRTDDISPYDQEFCKVDQQTLFELILAANYLDIKSLLDLTCKTVANMIKGKTPEEIKKVFGIDKDFTPEEEEAVRKENPWLGEK